jgi:5-hydroxyisourate hydrolase-like protein (transthyretin family)
MYVIVPRASRPLNLVAIVALCLSVVGCSSERKPANELKVVPVTGVVLVDGQPTAGIKIKMYSKTTDREKRAFPRGVTDEEGRFHAWTYRVNDGVPPGEYVVTYIDHSQANPAVRENPDGFRGRYADRNNKEHVITVPDSDEPFDLGEIPLSRP